MIRPVALAVFFAIFLVSATSYAQDAVQEVAAARALFDEGLALSDAGEWEQAADRFDRALQLRWSAPIAYNLAHAQAQRGKLLEAAEILRAIRADAETSPDMLELVSNELSQVEARFAFVTIDAPEDSVVHLDGEPVAPALLGVRVPVNPGEHGVELREEDEVVDQATFAVEEQGVAEVQLRAPAAPEPVPDLRPEQVVAPEVSPDPATPDRSWIEPREEDSGSNVGLYVGIGVGVAVVIAVVVIAVAASGTNDPQSGSLGTVYVGENP